MKKDLTALVDRIENDVKDFADSYSYLASEAENMTNEEFNFVSSSLDGKLDDIVLAFSELRKAIDDRCSD